MTQKKNDQKNELNTEINFDLELLIHSTGIHPSWSTTLSDHQLQLDSICSALNRDISSGKRITPSPQNIFRALKMPLDSVRVLIIGQDPYPAEGIATGLAFGVSANERGVPMTLRNILKEYERDIGTALEDFTLESWEKAGVMLLNSSLTAEVGNSNSHRKLKWHEITSGIVKAIDEKHGSDVVLILWGKSAQMISTEIKNMKIVSSPHPSPLSARKGFWGSKPFTAVNNYMEKRKLPKVFV